MSYLKGQYEPCPTFEIITLWWRRKVHISVTIIECFDTVAWASGSASSL